VAEVTFADVDKVYEGGVHAVQDLSLDIADGEFLVLVGPSGCGKTTALRMLAGLESISDGTIRIGERVVNDVSPKDRDIAMVFQSYALYPHLTVEDNIAFGLQLRKMPKAEIAKRVEWAARLLDLTPYLRRKPKELSGGQRQRVAMGRAIVREPQVFLMDEPLSNLDAKLRVQMRAEIAKLQKELATTTIYVTHDQVEAMTMGDRVAVMSMGVLQQVDAPQRLYDEPANLFVASFIGTPPMSLLETLLGEGPGGLTFTLAGAELALDPLAVERYPRLRERVGTTVVVGIRSEDVHPAERRPELPSLPAQLELVEALGSGQMAYFVIDATSVRGSVTPGAARSTGAMPAPESEGGEGELASSRSNLTGHFPPRFPLALGDTVQVALDTANHHFFDPETGAALR
jgi:multiple sugar transport system ATP-binding protein